METTYPLDMLSCIVSNDVNINNVTHISTIIKKTSDRNSSIPSRTTKFDSVRVSPSQPSVEEYIERFVRYTSATGDILIKTVIILDRFLKYNPDILIKDVNVHRLFAAAFVCTYKFCDDVFYSNRFLAKIAGIPLEELNTLEREFLFNIEFNMYINFL
jgi:hypothetical protein